MLFGVKPEGGGKKPPPPCQIGLKNTDSKNYWKSFKNIKKDTSPRLFTVNKKQDKTSITEEFAQHFENLLNTPEDYPTQGKKYSPNPSI